MFPVIPVIAVAGIELMNKCRPVYGRATVGVLLLMLLIKGGDYMYTSDTDSWEKAHNIYKIPQKAVDVADALLEMSDEPRVIVPDTLFCYMRQYSTAIEMMYGRDAQGYIAPKEMTEDAKEVYQEMCLPDPDEGRICDLAKKNGFEFIVSRKDRNFDPSITKEHGYVQTEIVGSYEIYRCIDFE